MKVILDELYPEEFFRNGGIINMGDGVLIDTYGKWQEYKMTLRFDDSPISGFDQLNSECDIHIGESRYRYEDECGWFVNIGNTPKLQMKDPYHLVNCNFSCIDEQDSRWKDYTKQRIEHGFDDSELWCFDVTIAKFILPRLKRYAEIKCAYPAHMTEKRWNYIVNKMIVAFDIYLNDNDLANDEEVIKRHYRAGIIKTPLEEAIKKHNDYIEGMKLFSCYWTWLGD